MTTGILQNILILIQEEPPCGKTNKGDLSCLVRIAETGFTKFFRVE